MARKEQVEIAVVVDDKATAGLDKVGKATEKAGSKFSGLAGEIIKAQIGFTSLQAVVSKVIKTLSDSVKVSEEFRQAFSALSAVASAFGVSAEEANDAARKLSDDGLLTLSDSAMGLRNLLASGLDLDTATQLMETFKNSASANRRTNMSFAQQIVTTTEGIKNQNSILTDNSGIATNYNVLLKRGAAALDVQVSSLNDQQKAQIVANGFIKEGSIFTGFAAKEAEKYTGQVSKLGTQIKYLKADLGTALKPSLTIVVQAMNKAIASSGGLTGAFQAITYVSTAVVTSVQIMIEGFISLGRVLDGVMRDIANFVNLDFDFSNMNAAIEESGNNIQNIFDNAGQIIAETQNEMKDAMKGVAEAGEQSFGSVGNSGAEAAKKIADAVEEANKKLETSLKKLETDYKKQLTELIWAHKDKKDELIQDIKDENEEYKKSLREREHEFKKSQQRLKDQIEDMEEDKNDEILTAEDKLAKQIESINENFFDSDEDVKKRLIEAVKKQSKEEIADIKKKHNEKIAEVKTEMEENTKTYKEETQELKQEHEERVTDFREMLAEEKRILKLHAKDVRAVGERIVEDDISILKAKFKEQKAELRRQHQERLESIKKQASAEGSAGGDAFNKAFLDSIEDNSDKIAKEVKETGKLSAQGFVSGFEKGFAGGATGGINVRIGAPSQDGTWNQGGFVTQRGAKRFIDGGVVGGVGTTDKVKALLTPGEVVINPKRGQTLGNHINVGGVVINDRVDMDMFLAELGLRIGMS